MSRPYVYPPKHRRTRDAQLRAAAERALKACGPLIADMEKHLRELQERAGIFVYDQPQDVSEAKGSLMALAAALEDRS